jgi:hypothetical protein
VPHLETIHCHAEGMIVVQGGPVFRAGLLLGAGLHLVQARAALREDPAGHRGNRSRRRATAYRKRGLVSRVWQHLVSQSLDDELKGAVAVVKRVPGWELRQLKRHQAQEALRTISKRVFQAVQDAAVQHYLQLDAEGMCY